MSLPAVEVEEHPARKKNQLASVVSKFGKTKITVNVNYMT